MSHPRLCSSERLFHHVKLRLGCDQLQFCFHHLRDYALEMLVPEVLERRLGRMVILIENLSGGGNRDIAVLDQDLQLVLGRFDIFLKSLLLRFQAFSQSPVVL